MRAIALYDWFGVMGAANALFHAVTKESVTVNGLVAVALLSSAIYMAFRARHTA